MVGEGLVAAYELETAVAKSPRIVVHDQVIQRELNHPAAKFRPDASWFCRRDADGCWYLDVLSPPHPTFAKPGIDSLFAEADPPKFLQGVRNGIVAGLAKAPR